MDWIIIGRKKEEEKGKHNQLYFGQIKAHSTLFKPYNYKVPDVVVKVSTISQNKAFISFAKGNENSIGP